MRRQSHARGEAFRTLRCVVANRSQRPERARANFVDIGKGEHSIDRPPELFRTRPVER